MTIKKRVRKLLSLEHKRLFPAGLPVRRKAVKAASDRRDLRTDGL